MKPGDLVRVLTFKSPLARHPELGVLAVIIELIPNTDICIIMSQGKEWTTTTDQLELINETR